MVNYNKSLSQPIYSPKNALTLYNSITIMCFSEIDYNYYKFERTSYRMKQELNIKDIAALSGVSVATVSRVINSDARVSKKSTQKVLKVIKETGYVPNLMGRNLRTNRSGKIMAMLPTISNPFYSKIIKGIEQCAGENGLGVFVVATHSDKEIESKYIDMAKSRQVDGIINFFSTLSAEEINEVAKTTPIVQCCEYTQGAAISYVHIDNYLASRAAVEYLIKRGHKRIAVVSGDYYKSSEAAREAGYRDALAEAGIEYDPCMVAKSDYEADGSELCCEKFLAMDIPPTAFFVFGDPGAAGVIRCLTKRGIAVGKEADVIGFDNTSISKIFMPSITTVSQPRFDLGYTAVNLLLEKIENINSLTKGVVLPFDLILRESTGSLPSK